jgi:hypothetical protein
MTSIFLEVSSGSGTGWWVASIFFNFSFSPWTIYLAPLFSQLAQGLRSKTVETRASLRHGTAEAGSEIYYIGKNLVAMMLVGPVLKFITKALIFYW